MYCTYIPVNRYKISTENNPAEAFLRHRGKRHTPSQRLFASKEAPTPSLTIFANSNSSFPRNREENEG